MEGVIVSFRRGVRTQNPRQMIIQADGIDSKEKAEKQVGKVVAWESPAKKVIKGKISAVHGAKGALRTIFETGMPGQSLGTKVKIE